MSDQLYPASSEWANYPREGFSLVFGENGGESLDLMVLSPPDSDLCRIHRAAGLRLRRKRDKIASDLISGGAETHIIGAVPGQTQSATATSRARDDPTRCSGATGAINFT